MAEPTEEELRRAKESVKLALDMAVQPKDLAPEKRLELRRRAAAVTSKVGFRWIEPGDYVKAFDPVMGCFEEGWVATVDRSQNYFTLDTKKKFHAIWTFNSEFGDEVWLLKLRPEDQA